MTDGAVSEWREEALGDVLTLQRGFDITKKMQRQGDVPVVSSSGIGSFHDEPRVTGPGVVIGRKGSLGTAFFVHRPYWPHDTTLWVKDFKGNDPFFCYLLLTSLRLVELDVGAANPTLNRNHVHRLRVLVPPVRLQRRIGSLVASFDELIEINNRRIELLEDATRSLYREWFVRFRFPGYRDITFVESELGAFPEGWQAQRLRDVATINRLTARAANLPDPLEYLDISALGQRQLGEAEMMSAESAPGRARRRVRDGDTLWTTVRPNRRAHALVHDPPDNLIVSTGLAVLTPNEVPSSFLFEYSSSPEFTDYLVSRATGAAYPAVRSIDFEDAPIAIPPNGLLEQFDQVADASLRIASALATITRRLAATRDLLLPRLVTGQLDISDIDLGDLLPPEAA